MKHFNHFKCSLFFNILAAPISSLSESQLKGSCGRRMKAIPCWIGQGPGQQLLHILLTLSKMGMTCGWVERQTPPSCQCRVQPLEHGTFAPSMPLEKKKWYRWTWTPESYHTSSMQRVLWPRASTLGGHSIKERNKNLLYI